MKRLSNVIHQGLRVRQLHATSSRAFPRQVGIPAPPQLQKTGLLFDEDVLTPAEEEDTNEGTSAGHMYLGQQRQVLQYMRLIEHDMPKLVQYRVPFTPPSSERPLIVRTIDYCGEEHPAASKRVVVSPVSQLPLRTQDAIHNIKLLAGARWSPEPPRDSGIGSTEKVDEHGYIKISCEDFPEPGMNLKWISDAFDRLIDQAHSGKRFTDVPVDTRHIEARKRKAKKGEQDLGARITLKDFPKEWLPVDSIGVADSPHETSTEQQPQQP
ncbi:hypothetical protein SCHPADRAFT_965876 [Schizopora paradoxa]|uniref:Small ribosomal subunit protein mS35 mitochondrial conserved domain-containing protein n=1 Tax=Schizopora paradoxa TaxID=27342 RepID=A0A0H2SC52_9AGAM|nr:hypothetical protein SCHPADRAFT_965876 [Schizopora paradoxa]